MIRVVAKQSPPDSWTSIEYSSFTRLPLQLRWFKKSSFWSESTSDSESRILPFTLLSLSTKGKGHLISPGALHSAFPRSRNSLTRFELKGSDTPLFSYFHRTADPAQLHELHPIQFPGEIWSPPHRTMTTAPYLQTILHGLWHTVTAGTLALTPLT